MVNRIPPAMNPQAYKTYQIRQPLGTHYRVATCEEFGCEDYQNGWMVKTDGLPPAMVHAARNSGRKYTELEISETEHALVFEAGQPCFRASTHKIPLERPAIFLRRNGDFRTPRTPVTRFKRPEDWRDDFGEHQEKLADRINRG